MADTTTAVARPTKSAYDKLPRRLKRFVDQYVVGATPAAALVTTGYLGRHPKQVAHRHLKKPEVAAAIEEATKRHIDEMGLRQITVLRQFAAIATSDPRKLEDENGKPIPLHKLDEATAAAISSVEIESVSSNGESGTRYKYKFWDKVKAGDRLGQFVKLWEARATNVNVDARSVTVNANDPAGQAALRAVAELGSRLAGLVEISSDALPGADRSVLPAAVCDGAQGCGESVADRPDQGSPERP